MLLSAHRSNVNYHNAVEQRDVLIRGFKNYIAVMRRFFFTFLRKKSVFDINPVTERMLAYVLFLRWSRARFLSLPLSLSTSYFLHNGASSAVRTTTWVATDLVKYITYKSAILQILLNFSFSLSPKRRI
jgi:hypothetical protein